MCGGVNERSPVKNGGQSKLVLSRAFLRAPSTRMRLLRSLNLRKEPGHSDLADPQRDARLHDWKINSIREAIAQDWSKLADKNLTPDQRKAIREHLDINTAELRDLVGRNREARLRNKMR